MHTLKTLALALIPVIISIAVLAPMFSPVANAGENAKYRLTVNATPSDSRIRIMNIKPKYRHGIALKPGKYDIEVTRSGYESKRGWVEIKQADLSIDVMLNKLGAKERPLQKSLPNEADNAALIQYALQLRQTHPQLFAGAQGILIMKIEPNSQAEKKGLRRGDIIVAYARQPINSAEQLINTVQAHATQPQVALQIIRANVVQTIVVTGGKMGVLLTDIKAQMSIEQFEHEFLTALQLQNEQKIQQLFLRSRK